jgi:hypothetical protein
MKRKLAFILAACLMFQVAASASQPRQIDTTPPLPNGVVPIEVFPDFKLLYWSAERLDEVQRPEFVAEGRWEGQGTINAPIVQVTAVDVNGNVLGAETILPIQLTVASGKRVAYNSGLNNLRAEDLPQVDRFVVTACPQNATDFVSSLTANPSISDIQVETSPLGYLSITGDIQNNGPNPVGDLSMVVLVYDDRGFLITTAYMPSFAEVLPGRFVRVSVSINPGPSSFQYRVIGIQSPYGVWFGC